MEKCLVTKLKGVVDNAEIQKVGEIKIHINKISNPTAQTQQFSIATSSPIKLKIVGNGYFTDSSLTQNLGTEITTPSALISYYLSNEDYYLVIPNKYAITYFLISNTIATNKSNVDISVFKYSPLKQLKIEGFSMPKNNLSDLSNITTLNQLNLNSTLIKGDISSLSNLTNLSLIILNSDLIYGDIQAFRNFVNLRHLQIINSPVEGNINTLSN